MKKIFSEDGFSMVQVIIAAALAGGLALVIAKLGQNQSELARKAHQDFESVQAANTLEFYLSKSETCGQILGGKAITGYNQPANPASTLDIDGLTVTLDGTARNISRQLSSRSLKITEAYLSQVEGSPVNAEESGPVELRVLFSRDSDTSRSGVFRKFPLFVELDASGQVADCYSNEGNYVQEAMTQFCENQFGGTWETSVSPAECQVDGLRLREWIESLSGGSCGINLGDDCSASNCCANTLTCNAGSCQCPSGLTWDPSLSMCHIACPAGTAYNTTTYTCDPVTCPEKTVVEGTVSKTLPEASAGDTTIKSFIDPSVCPACDPGEIHDHAKKTIRYTCQNSGEWNNGQVIDLVCICKIPI